MSDMQQEAQVTNTEVQKNTEFTVADTAQYSEIELQAIDMGWRPKEEWQGNENDFIDAKNFVRNKSLFDKIDSLSKRVKDQDKALNMLKEHHSKVEEATRQQVISELKKAKKAAYEDGDVDRAIEIDDEIAKQRAIELYEKKQEKQDNQLHPDFVSWVEKNSWYAQDPSLRAEADALGMAYRQINQDKSPEEVLEYVTKQVKKLNPDKFKNPNRAAPSIVDSGTGTRSPSKKEADTFQLSAEEERVMKTFVRNGVMSRDDYIKELKKVRGAN